MSGQTVDIETMIDGWLSENQPQQPETTQETPSENTDTVAGGQEATPPAPQEPAKEGETQQQPAEPAKPGDNTQRPADKAPQQQPARNPGDLVDAQGRVIAKAGAERRHYETAQRLNREVVTVRQELERTAAQLNAFREAAQLPTQLGLSPEESASGLQLAASWKANPVGTIKYLLEQAQAAGHNVEGLGVGTDFNAIKTMIANELAPFRQQAQTERQAQEAQVHARQAMQSLVADFGEQALTNGEALAKILDAAAQQGRSMSLEQAYLRFANWCRERGFDPHSPIDPQLQAVMQREQQQQPQQQQPEPPVNGQRMPPRPNGRAVAAPNGVVPMDSATQITGGESSRDLVRMAMREAGFNI